MKSERQHREDICRFGRSLHDRGFVAATDGNLSVRLDHETLLATPTGMSKGMMEPEDLVVVDMSGKRVAGRRNVSSEIAMHLLIYKLRPEVRGVVHAHPPTATGYAAAGIPLNQALCSEVVITLGCVPLAKYGTPGTPELTDGLKPLIPLHDAILMANHGVVTYGEDLLKAFMKMEAVEHFAKVSLVTHTLGRQQLLSRDEVDKLLVARSKYEGASGPAGGVLGCPIPAEGVPANGSATGQAASGDRFVVTREELATIVEDAVRHTKRRW